MADQILTQALCLCGKRARHDGPCPRPMHERIELFWMKVDKRGPIHPVIGTRCWLWTGRVTERGYGVIDWKSEGESRLSPRLAHRVAWFIGHGRWPEPQALHHCDNPPCVNYEEHLFEGTNLDNRRDSFEKGRTHNGNFMKTHCRRGHEYTDANTRTYLWKGKPFRQCRACEHYRYYTRASYQGLGL